MQTSVSRHTPGAPTPTFQYHCRLHRVSRNNCRRELYEAWITMNDNEDPDHGIDDSATVESSADVRENDELWRELKQMASSLCSRCHEFAHTQIRAAGDDLRYHIYHPSISSLQESTDAGCCFCKVLAQSLYKLCERFEPSAISTEPWSIRYRLLPDPLWHRHADCSPGAFCLQFYLWESDCDYAVRNSHESFPFATMKFFPTDLLGLGPDYWSTLTGQRAHPLLL